MTGTPLPDERYPAMPDGKGLWLVCNSASGSNSAAALEELEQGFADAGFALAGRTPFPQEDLPQLAELDRQGIETVAVFAGDGTINSVIRHCAGWGGAVLVLPGGTMNLLAHRLHGHRPVAEIVADLGQARRVRPRIVTCPQGIALAGLMAGPGTSWCEVREAMRDYDVAGFASGAFKALEESLGGAGIACRDPALGRAEGYPLLMFTPGDSGMEVEAYYAETTAQYVAQGWALLKRNFREGPHDELGSVERITIGSSDGGHFGLLLDGEPFECDNEVELVLATCPVDLLATSPDGH